MIKEVIARHEKIALQFSGGKDSLACLYYCRPWWDKIMVCWMNSGAAPPDALERMDAVRAIVPYFIEIKSNQPADIERNGYPVDLLPIRNAIGNRFFEAHNGLLMQPYMACCANNIWIPLANKMRELNITLIIRGQRSEDKRTSPVRNGEIFAGVEYCFPLENWTKDEVFSYLREIEVEIPAHYKYETSSVDCWDCTAYLYENRGRAAYLRDHHPALYPKFVTILKQIRSEMNTDLSNLESAINA